MTKRGLTRLPLDQNGHSHLWEYPTVTVDFDEPEPAPLFFIRECNHCGVLPTLQITDHAVVAAEPCESPRGITTSMLLPVPSGRIVYTDDLRQFYPIDSSGFANYNTRFGQAQWVTAMEAAGCAYGWVGNTGPDLWRVGKDRYLIGIPEYDDADVLLTQGWERVAPGALGLWAYCVADADDWITRGGGPGKPDQATVVTVTPGTYRFTHHTGEAGFDEHAEGPVVYADIERIG